MISRCFHNLYLFAKIRHGFFNLQKAHCLAVSQDGGNQTLWSGNSNTHVHKVIVDDLVTLDAGIDFGYVLESFARSLDEGWHESELDAMLVENKVLVLFSELDDVTEKVAGQGAERIETLVYMIPNIHNTLPHIDFIESGEGSSSILRLFQSFWNLASHSRHFHTAFCSNTRGCSRNDIFLF